MGRFAAHWRAVLKGDPPKALVAVVRPVVAAVGEDEAFARFERWLAPFGDPARAPFANPHKFRESHGLYATGGAGTSGDPVTAAASRLWAGAKRVGLLHVRTRSAFDAAEADLVHHGDAPGGEALLALWRAVNRDQLAQARDDGAAVALLAAALRPLVDAGTWPTPERAPPAPPPVAAAVAA